MRASCSVGSIWSMWVMTHSKRPSSQSPKSKGALTSSAIAQIVAGPDSALIPSFMEKATIIYSILESSAPAQCGNQAAPLWHNHSQKLQHVTLDSRPHENDGCNLDALVKLFFADHFWPLQAVVAS